ncbi:MAG TPA: hypothetical protein VEG84_07420, partial [Thermoanaerobaculia bacterium]|nr:hypothetical protein [Thermoanaerobaculia bacterium]
MKAAALLSRALVIGPSRRHPARVILPILGIAIGVAAVGAIYHANRSVTLSFREAAESIAGRSDFTVTGVGGVPVDALRQLSFLWERGAIAPSVLGSIVIDDGSGDIGELLGIDPGGDQAVREMKIV